MRGARVGAIVLGSLACVAALIILVGGGIVLGIGAIIGGERERRIESDANAVVVGWVAGKELRMGNATFEGEFELRLRATPTGAEGGRVFLGVGRVAEVDAYLRGVRFDVDPVFTSSGVSVTAGTFGARGGRSPTPPVQEGFWDASASGGGEQTLDWRLRDGGWVFVVMRPSGESGLAVDLTTQVRAPFIDWVSRKLLPEGFLLGGALLLAGIVLIVMGARRRRPPPRLSPDAGEAAEPIDPVGRF